MKILIPNATSPKNIGDLVILEGLKSTLGNQIILTIQSTDPNLFKKTFLNKASHTLYSWSVFKNKNALIRIKRVLELLYCYLTVKYIKRTIFISKELNRLINDYKSADLILFVGGGYLRSQTGISQTLNLLMTLLQFKFAKLTNAKKIVAPISFGPFAYKWQEKYSANTLKGFNIVAAREKYSYEILKSYRINNLILSSDTSFLLDFKKKINKSDNKKFVLGFTIRKWLRPNLQKHFESEFVKAIVSFSKSTGAVIQPIVQVDAPEYGDFDYKLTEEIAKNIKKKGIIVSPIKKVNDLKKSIEIYGKINLLLGMRMHSNILAAMQGTPFVAISYEYKTEGIAKDLGVEEYCIKVEDVLEKRLFDLIMKAHKNRTYLEKIIFSSIAKINRTEYSRWNTILK